MLEATLGFLRTEGTSEGAWKISVLLKGPCVRCHGNVGEANFQGIQLGVGRQRKGMGNQLDGSVRVPTHAAVGGVGLLGGPDH